MKKQRQALVVLGMHRSGTSALTRVLSLCGADLPKTLMKPQKNNNETGFWESEEVMVINNKILAALGSSWKDPNPFPIDWKNLEYIQKHKHKIVEIIQYEFNDSDFFVVKDPRICRLLPIWCEALEELEIEPLFVFSIRHPLEVAASLGKRDNLSKSHSLLLWLHHFLLSERETRQYQRVFTGYDLLLKNWQHEVDKIFQKFDIQCPQISDIAEKNNVINSFLSNNLKHHVAQPDLSELSSVPMWVSTVFKWFDLAAKTDDGEPDFADLDKVYKNYTNSDGVFDEIIRDLHSVGERWQELDGFRAKLRGEMEAAQLQLDEVKTELVDTKRHFSLVKAELTEAKTELTEVKTKLTETKTELAEVKTELTEAKTELTEIKSEIGYRLISWLKKYKRLSF